MKGTYLGLKATYRNLNNNNISYLKFKYDYLLNLNTKHVYDFLIFD